MEKGCRNCMWLYHMVTYNPTAPCSECLDYDKWQTAKRTNADRIRSMTDEELAWELARICRMPFYKDDSEIDEYEVDCWARWLRQEAGE